MTDPMNMKRDIHTDARQRRLYLAFFETCSILSEIPGGRDGALVAMFVGIAGMDGHCVNVSSIAEGLQMSRRTVKRKLDLLVDAGMIQRYDHGDGTPRYCRVINEEVNATRDRVVDAIYEIWHKYLGTAK